MVYQRLISFLGYDPMSGIFTRKVARGRCKAGSLAGRINHDGYVQIVVDSRRYQAHRLAWLFMTGNWPQDQIDHINGRRSDNRFDNLREATNTLNGQNQREAQRSNKSSGLLGVTLNKGSAIRPWQAAITVRGKTIYLGLFATPKAAHEAYLEAKRTFHPGCTI